MKHRERERELKISKHVLDTIRKEFPFKSQSFCRELTYSSNSNRLANRPKGGKNNFKQIQLTKKNRNIQIQ